MKKGSNPPPPRQAPTSQRGVNNGANVNPPRPSNRPTPPPAPPRPSGRD